MSDIAREHPLDLDSPRFSVKKPEIRFDKQGGMTDAERVRLAMQGFIRDFSSTTATYMESCIHCGHCAEACHFYKVTGDPKYTPIWKLEPFKQAYKREAGPFAFAYRAF
ncbi:MAG: 4Fe-4S dicluster domain-containing protein, partial [Burkholderiales bacterium]